MDISGLRVSRETREKLQHFAELFRKWAKSINLVAVYDGITLEPPYRRQCAGLSASSWTGVIKVDLGSGGGFPGIITAILMSETGGGWVSLVESNHKKAAFLRVALNETGARGSVHALQIEDAPKVVPTCDVVSARALADLDQLFQYASPWMCGTGKAQALFHKGRDYRAEVDKARGRWDFDLVIHESQVEADSVLLEVANLSLRK